MATPETLLPLDIAPHLRPLPSTGITRFPRYCGPLRHPHRPDLTLTGCQLHVPCHRPGLPVLRPFPSSMRAAANTPAEPVGACVARFPTGSSLPRYQGGSASASYPFEACSAFTRVAVAVGKRVTLLPPHRSPHARWGTGLLPRVFHGKTLRRPRVPDLDEWPIQCGKAHDIGDRGSILL